MNITTAASTSASIYFSDCECIRSIELFCGKRDFYKTCITCRNINSDVGKAISAVLLITLNEAIKLIPSRYDDDEEFHVDSTYKTNRPGHDLFPVVATVNGIGFPIAYFLLKMNPINPPVTTSTTIATATATTTNLTTTTTPTTADALSTPPAVNSTNEQLSSRSDLAAQVFTKLGERGLCSVRFMFTDKGEKQINVIANVFGEDAVRLCS
ncbi:hypothetical protein BDC45DRAFT_609476 [Circinella umbellata]|nr:hypothetical protein BDC45DRAFT_609476 [Circinella umbellata]